ncbi:hypothetical protein CBR64_20470 [Cellulosimicrobium cellulans]|uniref:Uncharacterized protein n=1 Tax=Cellulosimicrobium cellulans TaxID=1710 RepID=A0A1Y0HZ31_CELCE|nr:hypothetical protein CBR64_20470 [Cellulosimicrobium cellulans]
MALPIAVLGADNTGHRVQLSILTGPSGWSQYRVECLDRDCPWALGAVTQDLAEMEGWAHRRVMAG